MRLWAAVTNAAFSLMAATSASGDAVAETTGGDARAIAVARATESARAVGAVPAEGPAEDLWIIHGQRYDLREFARVHPGGRRAIEYM